MTILRLISGQRQMLQRLSPFLNIVLLSLASGVVPAPKPSDFLNLSKSHFESEFQDYEYQLGAYSHVLVDSLVGEEMPIEGSDLSWSCHLGFGNPPQNYSEWIHPVELTCSRGAEHLIFPLGEGEFRRAYTKRRVLIKGAAAKELVKILSVKADDTSVESPLSERTIAWGPSRYMKILSLRQSSVTANLRSSLECYTDHNTGNLHSCVITF